MYNFADDWSPFLNAITVIYAPKCVRVCICGEFLVCARTLIEGYYITNTWHIESILPSNLFQVQRRGERLKREREMG